MVKRLVLLLTVLLCILTINEVLYGKYATEFLDMCVGARALGMGGAFVGISNDASGVYSNPAGISQLEQNEINFMYADMYGSILMYRSMNCVFPVEGVGHLGVSMMSLTIPGIPDTRGLQTDGDIIIYDEDRILYDRDEETCVYFSYSMSLGEALSIGANVKMIRQKIFEYSSSGYGVDVGLMYSGDAANGARLGVVMQDATRTPVNWSTGVREERVPTVRAGIGYAISGITIAVDIDTKYGTNISYGGELMLSNLLALRAGYKSKGQGQNDLTMGAGFGLGENAMLDVAYVGLVNLGAIYRASLKMQF